MKTRPVNAKAMDHQFDEWTKAVARRPTRRKTLQLISGGLFGALLTSLGRRSWAASSTSAAAPSASPPIGVEDNIAAASVQRGLSICRNQEYALCAGVRCFVYNNVAYCRCNLQFGDSVSRRLSYAGGDVCTFNAEGSGNGYVVSTFSVPRQAQGHPEIERSTSAPRRQTPAPMPRAMAASVSRAHEANRSPASADSDKTRSCVPVRSQPGPQARRPRWATRSSAPIRAKPPSSKTARTLSPPEPTVRSSTKAHLPARTKLAPWC